MASVPLQQGMWKTVDVFGVEKLTGSAVDCTSDSNFVESIVVNEEKSSNDMISPQYFLQ